MSAAKPGPLTREELKEFLPSQRSVRAFEQLFSFIPSESEDFRAEIDAINAELEVINAEIDDRDVTKLVLVITNHIMDANAYTIVVGAAGLTLTLPKCSYEFLGRTWIVIMPIEGNVAIVTQGGDFFSTPSNPTETTVVLNRRGSTIEMLCTSDATWGFS